MFCNYCGAEQSDANSRFCTMCGKEIVRAKNRNTASPQFTQSKLDINPNTGMPAVSHAPAKHLADPGANAGVFQQHANNLGDRTPYAQPAQPNYGSFHQNNISSGESFVGLNILSKIGVVFVIIGIIAFAMVSDQYMGHIASTSIVGVLGAVMLVLGELFYRKNSPVFAMAITAGGILDFFVTVGIIQARMSPDIQDYYVVISLACMLITVVSGLFLAMHYKAKLLLYIAIIPAFIVGFLNYYLCTPDNVTPAVCSLLISLLLMHIAALWVSDKLGDIAIGYALSAINFITSLLLFNAFDIVNDKHPEIRILIMIYAFVSFSTVVARHVLSVWRNEKATGIDISNIITSTCFLGIFAILPVAQDVISESVIGIIFIGLSMATMGVSYGLYGIKKSDALVTVASNLTLSYASIGLMFVVPNNYICLSLQVLGAGVLLYGVVRKKRLFSIWGLILSAISMLSFWTFDSVLLEDGFSTEYTIISLLQIIFAYLLLAALYFFKINATGMRIYSYILNAYSAISSIYWSCYAADKLANIINNVAVHDKFVFAYTTLTLALCWCAVSYMAGRERYLNNGAIISESVYCIFGILALQISNFPLSRIDVDFVCNTPLIWGALLVNIISVLVVWHIVYTLQSKYNMLTKTYGLVVSIYILYSTTVFACSSALLTFTSIVLSIVYILMAGVWLFFGFRRNNVIVRRFGLALSLIASAKLFLIDFSEVDDLVRTIMFICFGISLLVISFVYALFEKKLRQRIAATNNLQNQVPDNNNIK